MKTTHCRQLILLHNAQMQPAPQRCPCEEVTCSSSLFIYSFVFPTQPHHCGNHSDRWAERPWIDRRGILSLFPDIFTIDTFLTQVTYCPCEWSEGRRKEEGRNGYVSVQLLKKLNASGHLPQHRFLLNNTIKHPYVEGTFHKQGTVECVDPSCFFVV